MEKLNQTDSKCCYCSEIFIGGFEECKNHVETCPLNNKKKEIKCGRCCKLANKGATTTIHTVFPLCDECLALEVKWRKKNDFMIVCW